MKKLIFCLLFLTYAQSTLAQDTALRSMLTLEGAKQVAASASVFARDHNAPGAAIAIVDHGGHLMYLERLDNTFPAGAEVSIGKARTAVMFRKPTRVFEDIVNKGRTAMVTVPAVTGFTPLQGGVPLERNGEIVGAIGVSGAASAQQDDDIAQAAATAFAAATRIANVTHIESNRVRAAFKAGEPLIEQSAYKVNASRRDGPGEAELHAVHTDIFYVLKGSATLITGGDIVDARQIADDEVRGRSITGGTSYRLRAGDVITIPNGVPHWFSQVKSPLTYYVVKSTDSLGG